MPHPAFATASLPGIGSSEQCLDQLRLRFQALAFQIQPLLLQRLQIVLVLPFMSSSLLEQSGRLDRVLSDGEDLCFLKLELVPLQDPLLLMQLEP